MTSEPYGPDVDRLPIGLFARATGLSIKALRKYDAEGLLKPAYTDPETRYRYYRFEQCPDAEFVRLLRSLDVPVSEIAALLPIGDSAELADALKEHRARIDEQLARLTLVRRQLDELLDDRRRLAVSLDVEHIEIEPEVGVSRREACPHDDLDHVEWRMIGELEADMTRLGLTPRGREWAIYHEDFTHFDPHDLELFQPVEQPVDAGVATRLARLAGGPGLAVTMRGSYEDTRLAYAVLLKHIMANALGFAGPPRERYTVDERDTDDPGEYVTDIVWPVRSVTG